MRLAALIRKNALTELATATPAIPATQPTSIAATVARIATIAVANPTNEICTFREWRISYRSVDPMTVLFTPPATGAEVAEIYRGATIEPIPQAPRRMATAFEVNELRELVAATLGEADRAEALAIALADPDAALECFRRLREGDACRHFPWMPQQLEAHD